MDTRLFQKKRTDLATGQFRSPYVGQYRPYVIILC